MELVGKHPTQTEAATYDISRDLPAFISIKERQLLTDEYTKYLKNSNAYFNNMYK